MPTYSKNLANGYRLDLVMTLSSQSVASNSSVYSYTLRIVDTTGWYAWSGYTASYSVRSPASSVFKSGSIAGYRFTSTPGNSITLASGSVTFGHNADGTSSRRVEAHFSDPSGPLGSGVAGGTLTSPTIARATTPTNPGTLTTGVAKVISLPRASSSFLHDVTYKVGSRTGTIATGAGVTATWNPPHDLATTFTTASSSTATITVVTKSGSTVIGSKSISVKLDLAASVIPTVSQVVWDDANPSVKANIGAFVQGLSLIKGAVTAAGIYGSTIQSKQIRVGASTVEEGTLLQITESGTVQAFGEAVDSRARKGSLAAPFGVLPYAPPRLGTSGWKVSRANASNVVTDGGQYLRIDLNALVSSLKVGTAEKNGLTIKVRTKASNGGWVNRNTITAALTHNAAIQVSGGGIYLASTSYEVEVTLSDKTGSTPTVLKTVVATATVTIDLNGTNVGVGKYHERGALDVAGEIYSTDAVAVWKSSTLEARLTDVELAFKNGQVAMRYGRDGITLPGGAVARLAMSGTAAQRAAMTPRFGEVWYDTDGPKYKWKGTSTGVWRRSSGTVRFVATAWDNSGNGIWARTAGATIPTAIESGEDIVLSTSAVANGFGSASRSGISESNWMTLTTNVQIRHYQFLNAQTNAVDMHWEIIDL